MILLRKQPRWILSGIVIIGSLYLSCAAAIFYFIKYHRGQDNVVLTDVLLLPLPGHWAQYEAKQGRALIDRSRILFNAGDFKAGVHALKVGLGKAPDNRDGLLLYAQLQIDLRRPDLAEHTLLNGLKYHQRDPLYFKTVLSFLFAQQKDQQAFALCDELLRQAPATPFSPELIQLATLGAATACYYRGSYDQAESYLLARNSISPREAGLLNAKIQWERGYREIALHQLRSLAQDFPNDEEVYMQLSSYLRDDSRHDEARQLSLIFQLARPDSAPPRIDLLRDTLRTHDQAALQTETTAVLRNFSQNPSALLALAEFAATTGNPALARLVQTQLSLAHREPEAAALLTLESLVVAKDYAGALAAATEFAQQAPPPAPHFLNISIGLQAIAHYGANDPAAGLLCLNQYLAAKNLRAGNLVLIAQRLKAIGARQPAREALARAVATDPLNQAALSHLIELDLEDSNAEALPANIRRLIATRKPSREILQRAQHQLDSDRFLFSRERTAALTALSTYLAAVQPPALRPGTN